MAWDAYRGQKEYETSKGKGGKTNSEHVTFCRSEDSAVSSLLWYIYFMYHKTLESPLDCKEFKPINLKENQPWIFIRRTDAEAEAEAPVLWPPHAKNWLIGKDPDVGKDWG